MLSRPANDFVSRFIGLGRGYRWLQLIEASALTLRDIERIPAGSLPESLSDGWAVVVDDAGAPMNWIDTEGLSRLRAGAAWSDCVSAIGSLFRPHGNLSQALDAALSSPSGMGVAVDDGGKVIGGILAADVLAAVETQKRAD